MVAAGIESWRRRNKFLSPGIRLYVTGNCDSSCASRWLCIFLTVLTKLMDGGKFNHKFSQFYGQKNNKINVNRELNLAFKMSIMLQFKRKKFFFYEICNRIFKRDVALLWFQHCTQHKTTGNSRTALTDGSKKNMPTNCLITTFAHWKA